MDRQVGLGLGIYQRIAPDTKKVESVNDVERVE